MATCKDCFHWNACKKMLEAMWGHSVPSGYEGGADRCEDFISAADVVPRAEVAREIFEEIDTMIFGTIIPNDCAIISIAKLAELKKKYTEARNE